jgi:hypothetical protein
MGWTSYITSVDFAHVNSRINYSRTYSFTASGQTINGTKTISSGYSIFSSSSRCASRSESGITEDSYDSRGGRHVTVTGETIVSFSGNIVGYTSSSSGQGNVSPPSGATYGGRTYTTYLLDGYDNVFSISYTQTGQVNADINYSEIYSTFTTSKEVYQLASTQTEYSSSYTFGPITTSQSGTKIDQTTLTLTRNDIQSVYLSTFELYRSISNVSCSYNVEYIVENGNEFYIKGAIPLLRLTTSSGVKRVSDYDLLLAPSASTSFSSEQAIVSTGGVFQQYINSRTITYHSFSQIPRTSTKTTYFTNYPNPSNENIFTLRSTSYEYTYISFATATKTSSFEFIDDGYTDSVAPDGIIGAYKTYIKAIRSVSTFILYRNDDLFSQSLTYSSTIYGTTTQRYGGNLNALTFMNANSTEEHYAYNTFWSEGLQAIGNLPDYGATDTTWMTQQCQNGNYRVSDNTETYYWNITPTEHRAILFQSNYGMARVLNNQRVIVLSPYTGTEICIFDPLSSTLQTVTINQTATNSYSISTIQQTVSFTFISGASTITTQTTRSFVASLSESTSRKIFTIDSNKDEDSFLFNYYANIPSGIANYQKTYPIGGVGYCPLVRMNTQYIIGTKGNAGSASYNAGNCWFNSLGEKVTYLTSNETMSFPISIQDSTLYLNDNDSGEFTVLDVPNLISNMTFAYGNYLANQVDMVNLANYGGDDV